MIIGKLKRHARILLPYWAVETNSSRQSTSGKQNRTEVNFSKAATSFFTVFTILSHHNLDEQTSMLSYELKFEISPLIGFSMPKLDNDICKHLTCRRVPISSKLICVLGIK